MNAAPAIEEFNHPTRRKYELGDRNPLAISRNRQSPSHGTGFRVGGALSRQVMGITGSPRKFQLHRGATVLLIAKKSFIRLQPNNL
jgi:hypothetical protein